MDWKRIQLLLSAMIVRDYREPPPGVGQKTVNTASSNGWIVSRKSDESKPLPDRHKLTRTGKILLRRLRQASREASASNSIESEERGGSKDEASS